MKKGNKKLLVIAALLLLVGIGIGTYAIYKASATGNATVSTAAFVVKANDTNIETGSFTFSASDISWTTTNSAVSGKIAPGATGTITLEIDATGSEVDVDYTVGIGTILVDGVANSNSAFTVTGATSADASGTISYSTTANAMKKTITLNVVWTATDEATQNTTDLSMDGIDITIPVTVTAQQHIGA